MTLEGRAGALSALHSLLIHCPSLVNNDDTAKRLTQPIDGAIAVLTKLVVDIFYFFMDWAAKSMWLT